MNSKTITLRNQIKEVAIELFTRLQHCNNIAVTRTDDDEYLQSAQMLFHVVQINGNFLHAADLSQRKPWEIQEKIQDHVDGVVIISQAVNCDTTKLKLRQVHEYWRERLHVHGAVTCVNLHMQTENPYPHDLYTAMLHTLCAPTTIALARAHGVDVQCV